MYVVGGRPFVCNPRKVFDHDRCGVQKIGCCKYGYGARGGRAMCTTLQDSSQSILASNSSVLTYARVECRTVPVRSDLSHLEHEHKQSMRSESPKLGTA